MTVLKVWECPCGYRSLTPGRCRSHPYPFRMMGPDMGEPAEYVPVVKLTAQPAVEAAHWKLDGVLCDFNEDTGLYEPVDERPYGGADEEQIVREVIAAAAAQASAMPQEGSHDA